MTNHPLPTLLLALILLLGAAVPAAADFPWPPPPPGTDPSAYHEYLFTQPGQLPGDFDADDNDWMLNSDRDSPCGFFDPPDCDTHELQGVKGASVDRAWETTTGRPDVVLAVLDDGIQWHLAQPDLANKIALNAGELPLPAGSPLYDANQDGVFNIQDYAADPAVSDANGNGQLDPEDLILLLSDGVDDDANGYADDIAGWDFFQDDNNPRDDTLNGHGTNRARDAAAEAENRGMVGVCPNCMILPLRIGDTFMVDANDFAQGVLFAVDHGAAVVQAAIGALNNTTFARQAVDYAYRRGVPIVAAAGDEQDAHHNYPAAYNHVIMVNAINKWDDNQLRHSYLYLNGCTNVGPKVLVSVPAKDCSSMASSKAGGMLGLAVSAARNAQIAGILANYPLDDGSPAPFVLSANELRQLLAGTADDVDFSGDYSTIHLFVSGSSERFHSTPSWDRYFGYGRVNAQRLVARIAAGQIPLEADITSPRWFQIVDPAQGTLQVSGRAAANRITGAGGSFTYTVDAAAGVSPLPDDFVTLHSSGPLTAAISGTLATVDLADVAALLPAGTTGPLHDGQTLQPDRFAWTLRLRVTASRGQTGQALVSLHLHTDPDLLPGYPRWLGAGGTSSPAFADLNPPPPYSYLPRAEELLLASDDGWLHAWQSDGSELPGWPVHTTPLNLHLDAPAYRSGEISLPVYASPMIGAPAIGDLDNDGHVEIVLSDLEGRVYAWSAAGELRPGFPLTSNPAYSQIQRPDGTYLRDTFNRVDHSFLAQPALADLSCGAPRSKCGAGGDGSLEIIAGGSDRHVYAWQADGTTLPGWPVLLQSPEKVAAVEPGTHFITHTADSGVQPGSRILATPSVGDITGDGLPEVLVSTNEGYAEPANIENLPLVEEKLRRVLKAGSKRALAVDPSSGNSRVYAINRDGTLHDGDPSDDDGLDADAFVNGWPARAGVLILDLLPLVGSGVNSPAVLGDVDGDGDGEVGAASFAGPFVVWQGDGISVLGQTGEGIDIAMDSEAADFGANSNSSETSQSYAAMGGGIFADFDPAAGIAAASPAVGLGRAVDMLLNSQQTPNDDLLSAWGAASGSFLPGFPHVVSDLQFLSTPISADVDGDRRPELLAATATNDFHALRVDGAQPAGWPKLTGGWATATPAVGDWNGDGRRELALVMRDGWLLVWDTVAAACSPAPWPRFGHDSHNSSNYDNPLVEPWGHATDVDDDCDVDNVDVQLVAGRWQCVADDACYDPRYDLNGDDVIDLADVTEIAVDWTWRKR